MKKNEDKDLTKNLNSIKSEKLKELNKELEAAQERIKFNKLHPYDFSHLSHYLSFEKWFWQDALLILSGADITGADVNWDGYENYAGVHIDLPSINNVSFLKTSLPDYDLPIDSNIEGWEDQIAEKKLQINTLTHKLRHLYEHRKNSAIAK